MLLVTVSSTFKNSNVFVDEFVDARLFEFGRGKTTESCVRTESAMLLCFAYCVERLTLARGCCNDRWNSTRENQNIEVMWVMHSLDVSGCAGDIGKPIVNTTKMHACGTGTRNVF